MIQNSQLNPGHLVTVSYAAAPSEEMTARHVVKFCRDMVVLSTHLEEKLEDAQQKLALMEEP